MYFATAANHLSIVEYVLALRKDLINIDDDSSDGVSTLSSPNHKYFNYTFCPLMHAPLFE